MEEKNFQIERLVFFSDAVIAIAITLLALDIKIEPTESGHLQYADIWAQWRVFAAFGLSFLNIANFWIRHHTFFVHINQIDQRLLWWNILWLLFIILLPFSTSLVSAYFSSAPAMVIYSLNTLLIAVCQNAIWGYSSRKGYVDQEKTPRALTERFRAFCNLDIINNALGLAVAFFNPVLAFILLVTKIPLFVVLPFYFRKLGQRP